MKTLAQNWLLLVIIAMAIAYITSCTAEQNDPCNDTKWEQAVNYSVQPKLKPALNDLPDDKNLKDAVEIKVVGSVKKYHCGGGWSQEYQFQSIHDPRAIDDSYWNDGFYIWSVMGFDFDNDEDYLLYVYFIDAYFDDDRRYSLSPQSLKVEPPFPFDWEKSYFFFTISPDMEWN